MNLMWEYGLYFYSFSSPASNNWDNFDGFPLIAFCLFAKFLGGIVFIHYQSL